MANNTQQVEITIIDRENAIIPDDMDEMGKCCIYTVPEFIKKGKEEFYQPLVISIGPVFYKDPKLEAMQELKQIYLKCIIKHLDNASQSLELCNNFVRNHEREIRDCYQEQTARIPSEEFINMIVLDAAFLIFLFLSMSYEDDYRPSNNTELDTIENKLYMLRKFIGRDLLCVEENQLPFFVLTGMYNIVYGKAHLRVRPLLHIAVHYICNYHYFMRTELPNALSIKHLVHLQRECCCLRFSHGAKESKSNSENPCSKTYNAKQLRAAGVKFKLNESGDLFDITFDKSTGVLMIPKLGLYDDTEAFFRSILFFEQCHIHMDQFFTDYIIFLDDLIDTVEDIQLLQQSEIIQNELGSDEDAVDLFNKLAKNIFYNSSNFAFSDVSKDLKDYSSTRWNKWKAILWQRYFNHPWAIISVIYAIILLILTVFQSISGFISK